MGTRGALDHDLNAIRDDILRLGSLVSQAVKCAFDAFEASDNQLAQKVIQGDDEIDSLHHELEEHITTTVALQQPMAGDLRKLIADLLITNELERMGDYAEGVGRTTLRYDEGTPAQLSPLLKDMHLHVIDMIDGVMDAYLDESPDKARDIARYDDRLDELYRQHLDSLVTRMGSGELPVDEGTYLMWLAHNLERIGDRVTNIAERIVYARTGALGGLNPRFFRFTTGHFLKKRLSRIIDSSHTTERSNSMS
ncbi:MAG: phosphate signaling complex protein PhoU, partial [Anaerolineae bacterium]|nr:phosphate signaling complex protein PhoU [Anaerolineae bacterium]